MVNNKNGLKRFVIKVFVFTMIIGILLNHRINKVSAVVDSSHNFDDSIFDSVGRYEFNIFGNSNTYGVDHYTLYEVPKESAINIGNKGIINASEAIYTKGPGGVKQAFLIYSSSDFHDRSIEQAGILDSDIRTISNDGKIDLLNYPMTLISPSGEELKAFPEYLSNPSENPSEVTAIVDVTDFIKRNGNGVYIGKDISFINADESDPIASWEVIVIEESSNLPFRKTVVNAGASIVTADSSKSLTVYQPGLQTKSTGNITGQILVTGDGGNDISIFGKDYGTLIQYSNNSKINSDNVFDSYHKEDDFFKGMMTENGILISDINPNWTTYSGDSNKDIFLKNLSSPLLKNNVDKFEFNINTEKDVQHVNLIALTVDIEYPIINMNITNNASVNKYAGNTVNNIVSITTDLQNKSGLWDSKLTLSLPAGTNLVENSVEVDGIKLSSLSFSYNSQTGVLIIPVGTGSDHKFLGPNQTSIVKFDTITNSAEQVILNANLDGNYMGVDGTKENVALDDIAKSSITYNVEQKKCTITEKYQTFDGTIAQVDTSIIINAGDNYSKQVPNIPNYTPVDVKIDGILQGTTTANINNLDGDHEIIFVYAPIQNTTNSTTPNTTASNTTAPNTTAANTTAPNTTAPNTTEPNTTAPNTTAPNTTAPNTTASNTTAPNTTAPNTTAPNTTEPNTTAPNTTALNTTAPNTTAPNTTAPNTTAPNTTAPNTTAPNTTAPNITEPNTTAPNTTASNTTAPNTTAPNITEPNTTAPNTTEPNTTALNTTAPNTTATNTTALNTTAPNTTAPNTTVPNTTAPNTTVPNTTAPNTTAPNTTAPNTTAPNTTAPNTTAPNTTAPNTTIPNTTAPNTTEPNTTAPNTTAPNTTALNTTSLNTTAPNTSNTTALNTTNTTTQNTTANTQKPTPSINPLNPGDTTISGKGTKGDTINVTLPNGTVLPNIEVDDNGNWTTNIPTPLNPGDEIIATEETPNGTISDPVKEKVPDLPKAPIINGPINKTDTTITGKGEPGKDVVVTFPNGSTVKAPIDDNGNWSVQVPQGTTLTPGDEVKAHEEDKNGNKSPEAKASVVDTNTTNTTNATNTSNTTSKTSNTTKANTTSNTTRNTTSNNSTGNTTNNTVKVDKPIINTILPGDKQISGKGILGDKIDLTLPDGTKIKDIPVDSDGDWKTNINTNLKPDDEVIAVQKDPNGNISDPAYKTVEPLPTAPIINGPIKQTDIKIFGKGEPGKYIIVTFPNGSTQKTTVDENGNWNVQVPTGTNLKKGDVIKAYAEDKNSNKSPEDSKKVIDSTKPNPSIDPIKPGTTTISGKGTKGDTINVTLPNGSKKETKVDENGNWSINADNPLNPGDEVKAVETNPNGIPSDEISKIVPPLPQPPTIDRPVLPSDAKITGRGEPGKKVVITFPDGTIVKAPIGQNGKWESPIPDGVNLKPYDNINAYTEDENGDKSTSINVKVTDEEKPSPIIHEITPGDRFIIGRGKVDDTIDITLPDGSVIKDIKVDSEGKWKGEVPSDVDLKPADIVTAVEKTPNGSISNPETQIVGQYPSAPIINGPISPDDIKIKGQGEPNKTIVVTFPNGTTQKAPIGVDGKWEVPVPQGTILRPNDVIRAYVEDKNKNASLEAYRKVIDTTKPTPIVDQLTPGDKFITGKGTPLNTIEVTFPDGTRINTIVDENGYWAINVPDKNTLKPGDRISAIETTPDGITSDIVVKAVSAFPIQPIINGPIKEGDRTIYGKGEPGRKVVVTFPDGTQATNIIDADGKWQVDVPSNVNLKKEDKITAYSIDKNNNKSLESIALVSAGSYSLPATGEETINFWSKIVKK